MSTNTKMAEALRDAATSLETIGRLAGKPYYGRDDQGEPIQTYMGHNDEVRSYAKSRAGCAREALAAHDAEQAQESDLTSDAFKAGMAAMEYAIWEGKEPCPCRTQAAQAVPAGFVLVPVEPTLEMLTAAGKEDDKAFIDGMPHGATAADTWAAMLAAAPTPPAPEAPADTEAVTACWQDFGRTNEFRRAVKWSQDGEIPGALFVAFRAGLRAASPKALCDCGKKPAAECDKWEPGCDLGCSPEHARVVRLDKAQAAPEAQQAAGRASVDDWERELSAVMPADFKDWWQNSPLEWPAVAAAVIRSLRLDRDAGWEVAALAQRRERLTDEQIRREKPVCADWVSFRAGVRCAERIHGVGK